MGDGDRSLGELAGHRYARLDTRRKSGEPVPTTVWFAVDGGRAYAFTDLRSGKVKRIRNDPRVTLIPSTVRGRRKGREIPAEARVVDRWEHEAANRALLRKYGWQYRLAQAIVGLLGLSDRRAFIELRPAGVPEAGPSGPSRYSEITVRDRNPVKSYLQRRRLRDALRVLDGLEGGFEGNFLDFGGGSGELSRILAERFPRAGVFCYEPSPGLLDEASKNLAGLGNVVLVRSLEHLRGRKFGYVFCLEVFEHLPRRETKRAARDIKRLLSRGGVAVVGVPNELFIPALVKGLFRMTRRYGAFDARPGNVLRAVVGRPPERRPVREITPGLPYHFHHTGFDHRELRRALAETFGLERQFASPLGGELLGTEIYLVLKKHRGRRRQPGGTTDP